MPLLPGFFVEKSGSARILPSNIFHRIFTLTFHSWWTRFPKNTMKLCIFPRPYGTQRHHDTRISSSTLFNGFTSSAHWTPFWKDICLVCHSCHVGFYRTKPGFNPYRTWVVLHVFRYPGVVGLGRWCHQSLLLTVRMLERLMDLYGSLSNKIYETNWRKKTSQTSEFFMRKHESMKTLRFHSENSTLRCPWIESVET